MTVICLFYVKWLRLFFFCGNISRKSFRFPFVLNDFYDYFLIRTHYYLQIYRLRLNRLTMGAHGRILLYSLATNSNNRFGICWCIFVCLVMWWKMMILVVFVIILSSHISFFFSVSLFMRLCLTKEMIIGVIMEMFNRIELKSKLLINKN